MGIRDSGRTVNQIIFSKLPVSARTAGLAVVVALCVGIPLGLSLIHILHACAQQADRLENKKADGGCDCKRHRS